jgi:hypothetical protein
MNPPLRLGPFADTGYEVLWEDAERIFCKTWRVGVAGDRQVAGRPLRCRAPEPGKPQSSRTRIRAKG